VDGPTVDSETESVDGPAVGSEAATVDSKAELVDGPTELVDGDDPEPELVDGHGPTAELVDGTADVCAELVDRTAEDEDGARGVRGLEAFLNEGEE